MVPWLRTKGISPKLHLGLEPSLSLLLLAPLLFVEFALHLLKLSGQPLNLVFVLIDLGLVHVELGGHGLHLIGLGLQVLLVD